VACARWTSTVVLTCLEFPARRGIGERHRSATNDACEIAFWWHRALGCGERPTRPHRPPLSTRPTPTGGRDGTFTTGASWRRTAPQLTRRHGGACLTGAWAAQGCDSTVGVSLGIRRYAALQLHLTRYGGERRPVSAGVTASGRTLRHLWGVMESRCELPHARTSPLEDRSSGRWQVGRLVATWTTAHAHVYPPLRRRGTA